MDIMEIYQTVLALLGPAGPWWQVITAVVSTFVAISTVTKNTSDNVVANALLKGINFLAGNFGRSANKD